MEEKLKKINELTNEILDELHKNTSFSKTQKSFDLGMFQGSKSKAFSVARKLSSIGLSVEEISYITDLSSFEIKSFINN